MLDRVLSILAPHHCYGCQKPPKLLCSECKKHNIKNYNSNNEIVLRIDGKAILIQYISQREGALKALIDGYKFQREKISYKILAEFLNDVFPVSSGEIIIAIPTSSAHKRERGYDHMKLIGRQYAKLANTIFLEILEGNRNYSQHEKNYMERQLLSKDVFSVKNDLEIKKDTPIILIDDILTTGATMKSAVTALRSAGFANIKCRVIAYQAFSVDE